MHIMTLYVMYTPGARETSRGLLPTNCNETQVLGEARGAEAEVLDRQVLLPANMHSITHPPALAGGHGG